MQRALFVLASVLVVIGLASCDLFGPADDPSVAVKVLTQGAYTGTGDAEGSMTRSIARSVVVTGADFTGSDYAAEIAAEMETFAVLAFGLSFTDQAVVQDGETYTIDGALNYAFTLATPGDVLESLVYTAYLYGSGISISGPDYEGSVTVDLKESVSFTLTDSTVTMTCVVEGTVGDETVNETLTFSFEVATSRI